MNVRPSWRDRGSGALADVKPPTLALPLSEKPPLFQLMGGAMAARLPPRRGAKTSGRVVAGHFWVQPLS